MMIDCLSHQEMSDVLEWAKILPFSQLLNGVEESGVDPYPTRESLGELVHSALGSRLCDRRWTWLAPIHQLPQNDIVRCD